VSRFRRAPRPLAGALDALTQELSPETVLAEVQAAWRGAVGAAIAARARPVAERAGVLTVSCESSVWAQELDLMGVAIVARLNERLSGGRITRLRCIAGEPIEQV
jgi:predicted nucleic acid-binding Zn ribbon protein